MFTATAVRSMGFTRTDRYSAKNGLVELTNEDIRERAPSVFADSA